MSHNTAIYRFALKDAKAVAGLPVASCLLVKAPLGHEGKPVVRPYTPISHPQERGHFDLLVKAYPQGVMSKHFAEMKIGDQLEVKGPLMKLKYTPNMHKAIGMVAGGTGITPMLQIIEEVLRNPADKTQLTLVFANVNADDILLKPRLDALAKKHGGQFKVVYTLDKPPRGWQGPTGFVTAQLLKETMPPPGEDCLIVVCGPPGMMASISGPKAKDFTQGELAGALKQLGYTEKNVYKM